MHGSDLQRCARHAKIGLEIETTGSGTIKRGRSGRFLSHLILDELIVSLTVVSFLIAIECIKQRNVLLTPQIAFADAYNPELVARWKTFDKEKLSTTLRTNWPEPARMQWRHLSSYLSIINAAISNSTAYKLIPDKITSRSILWLSSAAHSLVRYYIMINNIVRTHQLYSHYPRSPSNCGRRRRSRRPCPASSSLPSAPTWTVWTGLCKEDRKRIRSLHRCIDR